MYQEATVPIKPLQSALRYNTAGCMMVTLSETMIRLSINLKHNFPPH